MRSYPANSPQAAGRLLALTIISDGNIAPSELSAMHKSRILEHVSLESHAFDALLHDLCDDLIATTRNGAVHLEPDMIDCLLDEIDAVDLRRTLLQAMWRLADADGWLADPEAVLLNRAAIVWGAESQFAARPRRAPTSG